MSKLSLLLLIATFALSGGVTAKKPPEQPAEATVAERAEPAKAAPAKPRARSRPEVIPLNTRGYNLPGPNDPPPAAIDDAPEPAASAPKPR
jgi:hypothetical protein